MLLSSLVCALRDRFGDKRPIRMPVYGGPLESMAGVYTCALVTPYSLSG